MLIDGISSGLIVMIHVKPSRLVDGTMDIILMIRVDVSWPTGVKEGFWWKTF